MMEFNKKNWPNTVICEAGYSKICPKTKCAILFIII